MKNIRLLMLLLLTIAFDLKINATEIIGGSLRYEALGNQQYKITGVVNRNCSGPALTIPTFKVYSGTTSFTLTATRVSIKDITVVCSKSSPPCNPSNTQTSIGQEQHTFEATINFGNSPYNGFYNSSKCEVMFSMESCCRSSQTTNMTVNDFYLEAMLNLCTLGTTSTNSNPITTASSYLLMCNNSPFAYNNGSNDKIDGDSIYYRMWTPKKSKDSSERFIDPYSLRYPIKTFFFKSKPLPNSKPPRGLFFDSLTGDMILTPMDTTNGAIINIRTEEYRKINNTVTLIGYSTTENFIIVKNCPDNNPPAIATSNKWSVCEGNKLCFTIQSTDLKALNQANADTITMKWNFGIPGGTFNIVDPTAREKSAEFCWQTQVGDARPSAYQFTVYAQDDNCPNPANILKGFSINVKPKAKAIRQYRKKSGNQLIFDANPTSSGNYTPTYEWQINDTLGHPALYKTFKQKDSFKFKDTGRYFITMTINNLPYNCPSVYIDTVYMDGKVTTSINKISLNPIHIYPNPTSGFITIDLDKNKTWTDMKLLNSIGQVVYTGPAIAVFDMSKYAVGFYTIELVSKEGKHIAQVVKE